MFRKALEPILGRKTNAIRLAAWKLAAALACISLAVLGPAPVSGQELQFRMDAYPTGVRPMGVDLGYASNRPVVVVANSGDESVSLFQANYTSNSVYTLELLATVRGIPSPHAVTFCGWDYVLVTSPTDDSVSLIRVSERRVLGKIRVGPQPYSAICLADNYPTTSASAVVSNFGDDSLAVLRLRFDAASFTVETRIPGVPSNKAAHGVAYSTVGGQPMLWVAGTSADLVTVLDYSSSRVLTRLAVRGPTSVRTICFQPSSFSPCFDEAVCIGSAPDNSVVCYDGSLNAGRTLGVPSPQDFLRLVLDRSRNTYVWFYSTGSNNSIAYRATGNEIGTIPSIPGAWGLVYGPAPLSVMVTSPDSNRVFLIQRPPPPLPLPQEFSIVHGASFGSSPVATNSLGSIFAATGASRNFVADSMPLPRTLGSVTVRFGGSLIYDSASNRWNYSPTGSVTAGLLFVGPNQINFQIPPEISSADPVPVQLQRSDGNTFLTALRLAVSAPGIFSLLANGRGQAAVLNQDFSLNGDSQVIFGARPALRGSVIQIFATGAGPTNPPLLAGEPAPASGNPLVLTQVQPTVTIGSRPARVLFSGMAPGLVGVWQINAEVPMDVGPGSAVPLQITAAGVQSNTVTIAVQ